jgi:hypothetical protein
MVVGVFGEHPVGHLGWLVMATVALLAVLPPLPRRTPRGEDALAHARRRHDALLVTARHAPAQLTPEAARLAYALLGAAVGAELLCALDGRALAGDSAFPAMALVAGCGAAGCGGDAGGDGGGGCGGD